MASTNLAYFDHRGRDETIYVDLTSPSRRLSSPSEHNLKLCDGETREAAENK